MGSPLLKHAVVARDDMGGPAWLHLGSELIFGGLRFWGSDVSGGVDEGKTYISSKMTKTTKQAI